MTRPTDIENACVFGLSWGDEGKGKIVDLLCPSFDVVVRFNGGANAGHTVCVGPLKYALHLLPSGVLHENAVGVIGPGVVVDPFTLIEEIDSLAGRGVNVYNKLKLSDRAHLVLPHHRLEDKLSEQAACEGSKIGTTARGIGPCYADKMRRSTAFRVADLMEDGFDERLRLVVSTRAKALTAHYGSRVELGVESVVTDLQSARERLRGVICDTTEYLHQAMDGGKRILFEGANGMLLDIDHGTYPFVTSSSTGPHGIGSGAGVPASRVTRLIGVTKAYATRVGAGPFVSELKEETGVRIRERGNEYGTTTGRPRRCGWFDAVSTRYAARLTGVTDIALMHLDTLSGFDRIGVCTGYRLDGRTLKTPPASSRMLEQAEPVIEMCPGWKDELREVRRFDDLPKPARAYVERIESLVGAPVSLIGVGPERSQTLVRQRLAHLVSLPEVSTA